MKQIQKVHCFFNTIMLLFIINISFAPALFSQNTQEIEVTIGGISSSDKMTHFNNGEELRKKMKFAEAISAYMKVISNGELCGKEAEAHYDIGICIHGWEK